MDDHTGHTAPTGHDQRTAALFASMISACLAVQYIQIRQPFGTPEILFSARMVGLALLLCNGPAVWAHLIRRSRPAWYKTAPALTLSVLSALCLIGYTPRSIARFVGGVAAAAGIVCFLWNLFRNPAQARLTGIWERLQSWGAMLILATLAVAFGLQAGAIAWGSGYQNPFLKEALLTHNGTLDTYYHMSIASMLRTYGAVSTGLDGIPYTPYHFGSHLILGQFANLLGVGLTESYGAAYAVVFIPFLVLSMLLLAMVLRAARGRDSRCISFPGLLLLLLGFCKFLPALTHQALGLWPEDILISESFLFGIILACLSLGVMIPVLKEGLTSGKRVPRGALVILPVLVAACGFGKISVALPLVGVLFYFALRLRIFRRPLFLVALLLSAFLFLWAMRIGAAGQRNELHIEPWFFLKNFVNRSFWLYFFFFHFFWSWIAALVRIRQEGVHTFGGLFDAVRARRLLDVEALVVICVLGVLPCLLLPIAGGSGFYFSATQWWLALPLLISTVRSPEEWRSERWRAVSLTTVAVALLSLTTAWEVADYVPKLLTAQKQLMNDSLDALRQNTTTRTPGSVPRLRDVPILAALQQVADLPWSEQRRSLLYIPPDNQAYWTLGPRRIVPFIAPALTGVAMVQGIPDFPEITELVQRNWCGFASYRVNDSLSTDPCRRTAQLGFSQLIVIESPETGGVTVRKLRCDDPAGSAATRESRSAPR